MTILKPQREAAQLAHEHMVAKQKQKTSHILPMALDIWGLPLLTEDVGMQGLRLRYPYFLNLLCSVGRDIVDSLTKAFHRLTFKYFVTDREQFKDTNEDVSFSAPLLCMFL